MGTTPVHATATDGGTNSASCDFAVSVVSAPTVSVAAASVQYSDLVTLSANVNAVPFPGQPLAGTVQFYINGIAVGSPVSASASGAASLPYTVLLAPGTYNVTAQFTSAAPAYYANAAGGPGTLTVKQEDARAYYTGALFASTSSATSGDATLTLAATIQDITAATGDPAYDPNAGDIRNATCTFINRDTSTPIATVPIGLVNAGDTKTGTATYNWSVDIGAANSQSFTVGIRVNNYYTRNSSFDNTVITVSKPLNDFITGGGYLILSNAAGLTAGSPGTKNNFGFNVKYNKSGTNLQGNINTIVRSGGVTYQI